MKFIGQDASGKQKIFESWREIARQTPYDCLDIESFTEEQLNQLAKECSDAVKYRERGDGIDLANMPDQPLDPIVDPIEFFAARQLSLIENFKADQHDYLKEATQRAEAILEKLYAPYEGLERTLIILKKQDDTREFSIADYGWERVPTPRNPDFFQKAPNLLIGLRNTGSVRSDSLVGRWVQRDLEPYTVTWYAITILENAFRLKDANSKDAVQLLIEIGMSAEALRRKANDKATRTGLRILTKSKKLGDIDPKTEEIHALLDRYLPRYKFAAEAYRKIVKELKDKYPTMTEGSVKKADQRRKSRAGD